MHLIASLAKNAEVVYNNNIKSWRKDFSLFKREKMVQEKENKRRITDKQKSVAEKGGTSNWDLMLLADEQDCEAFDAQDFEELPTSKKSRYKEFYNDVKQPSDYVKEDW